MRLLRLTLFASAVLYFQFSQAQNWETIDVSENCTARHESSLTAVGNKVVLLGGRGIKPTEIFDTETQTWTKHAETPIEIHHFQAVTFKGEVYVLGGFTGGYPHETPIENIYIFNIDKNEWRKGPEIPEDRRRGAAGCTVYNDKIYLVCGIQDGHWDGHVAWLDEYDPSTNSWRKLANAPHARDHVSVGVVNDKIYVAGGRRSSGKTEQVFNLTEGAVDVYDFSEDKWQTLPKNLDIPTQRAGSFAVTMGPKIVILGGESASQEAAHSDVEAFDTEKMEWEKYPSLVRGRHGTGAVVIDGKIYTAAGCGQRGGNPELDSIEVFK